MTEVPEATEGVSTQAPEPEPHGDREGQPFFQRAVNGRQLAHEAIKEVESKLKWFSTEDQQ